MTSLLPDQYLTTKQVLMILQINRDTLRNLIRQGKLKAHRIGAGWRIHPDDLLCFMRERLVYHQSQDKPRTAERQSNYVA